EIAASLAGGPATGLRRDQRIFVHVGSHALAVERLPLIDPAVASHEQPARRVRAAVAGTGRLAVAGVAARAEIDAVALVREVRRDAHAVRSAVFLVHARLPALAGALAFTEAVRACGSAQVLVPDAADGRVAPGARVDFRIARHGTDLLAAHVLGADLIRF